MPEFFYDDIYVLLVVYSVELCVVLNVWSYAVIIIFLTVAHITVAARLLLVLPTLVTLQLGIHIAPLKRHQLY